MTGGELLQHKQSQITWIIDRYKPRNSISYLGTFKANSRGWPLRILTTTRCVSFHMKFQPKAFNQNACNEIQIMAKRICKHCGSLTYMQCPENFRFLRTCKAVLSPNFICREACLMLINDVTFWFSSLFVQIICYIWAIRSLTFGPIICFLSMIVFSWKFYWAYFKLAMIFGFYDWA